MFPWMNAKESSDENLATLKIELIHVPTQQATKRTPKATLARHASRPSSKTSWHPSPTERMTEQNGIKGPTKRSPPPSGTNAREKDDYKGPHPTKSTNYSAKHETANQRALTAKKQRRASLSSVYSACPATEISHHSNDNTWTFHACPSLNHR